MGNWPGVHKMQLLSLSYLSHISVFIWPTQLQGPSDLTTSMRLSTSMTFQISFVWFRKPLVTLILFLVSPFLLVNKRKEF